jgi:hypothetical protein
MLAAWIESLGGAHAVTAFVAVVTAVVTCYRVRVRERMHAARLQAAQKIAEAGSAAVLGPDTAIVVPPSSPLTVDELLRAADATAPAPPIEGSSPKEISGRAGPTDLPPPVPPA